MLKTSVFIRVLTGYGSSYGVVTPLGVVSASAFFQHAHER
jgi:hypothetical protein